MLPGEVAVAGLRTGWSRFQACQKEMARLVKPEAQRMPIAFTQVKLGFKHGWPVPASAYTGDQ